MLWIDRNALLKLNLAKNNKRELLVEVVNSYGETGVVKGIITPNLKSRITDSFSLVVNTPEDQRFFIHIVLDRPDEKFNTFCALSVKDAETLDVMYENPNREILLNFNINNFNQKDEKNSKWYNDNGTQFMLNNIGQYVEFTPSEENLGHGYRPVKGILKCAYVANNPSRSHMVQILLDSDRATAMAHIRLPKSFDMTATSIVTGETTALKYRSKENVEDKELNR